MSRGSIFGTIFIIVICLKFLNLIVAVVAFSGLLYFLYQHHKENEKNHALMLAEHEEKEKLKNRNRDLLVKFGKKPDDKLEYPSFDVFDKFKELNPKYFKDICNTTKMLIDIRINYPNSKLVESDKVYLSLEEKKEFMDNEKRLIKSKISELQRLLKSSEISLYPFPEKQIEPDSIDPDDTSFYTFKKNKFERIIPDYLTSLRYFKPQVYEKAIESSKNNIQEILKENEKTNFKNALIIQRMNEFLQDFMHSEEINEQFFVHATILGNFLKERLNSHSTNICFLESIIHSRFVRGSKTENTIYPTNYWNFMYETTFKNPHIKELLDNKEIVPEDLLKNLSNMSGCFNNSLECLSRDFESMRKEHAIIDAGVRGEKRVKENMLLSPSFKVLENIRLDVDGNSIETDFFVFTLAGIFSLEVKNFGEKGSYEIEISKDGIWSKKRKDSNRPLDADTNLISNVFAQVNRHIVYTEQFLDSKKSTIRDILSKCTVKPIVVIANEDVTINNNSSMDIVRASHVNNVISQYVNARKEISLVDSSSNALLTEDEINLLVNLFKENALPAQKFPYETTVNSIGENLTKCFKILSIFGVMSDFYFTMTRYVQKHSEFNILWYDPFSFDYIKRSGKAGDYSYERYLYMDNLSDFACFNEYQEFLKEDTKVHVSGA